MSAREMDEAVARFHAGSEVEVPAAPIPRPSVRVDRPRPPFPARRVAEMTAAVALVVLLILRVVGGVG